jgi:Fe-S cluster biogenesis protein NfuA
MITVQTTPNPHAMKFLVGEKWINFVWECLDANASKKSPLAEQLWQIEGVNALLFGFDFVSVTKKHDSSWLDIQFEVIDKIDEFLKKDIGLFDSKHESKDMQKEIESNAQLSELDLKIIQVIEEKIQPAIVSHGGVVKFVSFANGVLLLDLQGACKGCPSSAVTLKNGIENLLQYYFPEIVEVKSV